MRIIVFMLLICLWNNSISQDRGYSDIIAYLQKKSPESKLHKRESAFYRIIKKKDLNKKTTYKNLQVINYNDIDTIMVEDQHLIRFYTQLYGACILSSTNIECMGPIDISKIPSNIVIRLHEHLSRKKMIELVNKQTGAPLNGFCKINFQDSNTYTLGAFAWGAPYFNGPPLGTKFTHFVGKKLTSYEFYRLYPNSYHYPSIAILEKDEIEFIEKRRIRRRIYDWDYIKSNKVLFEATYKKKGKKYVIEKWSLFLDGKERRGN